MANIVITTIGSNSIVVDFGSYTSNDNMDNSLQSFDNRDIVEVELAKDNSHVKIVMRDAHSGRIWSVTYDSSYTGSEYLIVDSVNTYTLSTQRDLFDRITELRG